MREAWFEIIKDPSRRATRRKTPKAVKDKQIGDAKAARVTRRKPEIDAYNEKNTRREFDVPDTGKKTFADRFKQFFNRRKVEGARKDYFSNKQKKEDARLQTEQDAKQRQLDIADWQASQLKDDEAGYQAQLAASQKEMAAGTQASKDKAALEAQEKEVERGTKAMDRGALAAQAAQQQMDSNEAARLQEQADAEAESYKKVKTDLGRKRLAQQYGEQNISDVQQREEGINVENEAEYQKEAERARQEYLAEQQRTVPLPQEAEVTSMPLPAIGSPNRPAGKRKLTAEEAERARLKQTGFDVGTSATVTQPNMPPYQPPKPKGKYSRLQELARSPAGKKRLSANVLRKQKHQTVAKNPKQPTMNQRATAGNRRQALNAARLNRAKETKGEEEWEKSMRQRYGGNNTEEKKRTGPPPPPQQQQTRQPTPAELQMSQQGQQQNQQTQAALQGQAASQQKRANWQNVLQNKPQSTKVPIQ